MTAWYDDTRSGFLESSTVAIANQLAGRATAASLELQAQQSEEWLASIGLLQKSLDERVTVIREALDAPGCEAIRHVILEFDFRRRGLRMDCLLLAEGVLFVLEFKRSRLSRSARDQVMSYAVNLLEFHEETQRWSQQDRAIVVPILVLTGGRSTSTIEWPGLATSWPALSAKALECDSASVGDALSLALTHRLSAKPTNARRWLTSPFRPSSSIVDAAISLFGNHDVAAIKGHEAPKAAIDASTAEIRAHIDDALKLERHHIVFLSGAPGAGKTLVGLDLVMRGGHAAEAVFVTGNAPLVDVLHKALSTSYRARGATESGWTLSGYRQSEAMFVAEAATYKIVKAHHFLGKRGEAHDQADARILVFDEAQRTYEAGRQVLGKALTDHEADLILHVQEKAFPSGGSVVVALIGHNQAIGRGERGIAAWLEAAERLGWTFSIGDETLGLAEFAEDDGRSKWAAHPARLALQHGHLHQSMRFYRNAAVEAWADAVLIGNAPHAKATAEALGAHGIAILLTRSLADARAWAKPLAVGEQRAGLIASGQARRLAAEGLFVDHKPSIADWMLAPNTDIRSSTSMETVQNQYQVQGLELDYTVVCWDADLRREADSWQAYRLKGSDWQRDKVADVAKNGYRVLLTRARKGMVIFVPLGDRSGNDQTRLAAYYDGVADYLVACGASALSPK